MKTPLAIIAALGLTVFAAGAANAAEGNGASSFMGHAAAPKEMAKQCPGIEWLVRAENGQVTGYAAFDDGSGVSKLAGTYTPAGAFTFTVTSLDGHGPAGDVTGSRTKAGMTAKLVGQGCSNVTVARMAPVPAMPFGNGGGRG
jgi:hypothetical protein